MFFVLFYVFTAVLRCGAAKTSQAPRPASKEEGEASSKASTTTTTYSQELVFGYENKKGGRLHWCDVKLTPSRRIEDVVIFARTGTDPNAAVGKHSLSPKKQTGPQKYTRIEIPDSIEKDAGQVYSFKFNFNAQEFIFSESWAYNPDKDEFSLVSGISKPFYKRGSVIAGISIGVILLLLGALYAIRSMRKSKATL